MNGLLPSNELVSQASYKGLMTHNISQKSLINTGTKEISLKRFIEKIRELLLPQSPSPILKTREPSSAAFALEKLADLEKTNMTRIRSKREEALNEIIMPKLELL